MNKSIGFSTGISSAIIMGTMGLFVRNIPLDGVIIAFARLGIGLIFLSIILIFIKGYKSIRFKNISIYVILSGVMMAANILFYINAISLTSLANAAFILYLAPIIATILAYFILGESVGIIKLSLLILSFSGFALLMYSELSGDLNNIEGNIYGLAAAFCYGLFIVFNRKIPEKIMPLERTLFQFIFGTILLLPFVVFLDLNITLRDAYWLVGVGLFQGFIALTLFVVSIRFLKTIEYGTISYLEPLTATLIGFFIYSENMTFFQIIGCSIILIAGFLLLLINNNKAVVKNS